MHRSQSVAEYEDTAYNRNNLPRRRYQREDMLLEIGDDIVDRYLACYLQDADQGELLETLWVLEDELQAWDEGARGQGVGGDQQEGEEVSRGEQVVGRGLEH